MKPLPALLSIALFVPTSAFAAPFVWFQVPEYRVNNVETHEDYTASVDSTYEDHQFAVERRMSAVDRAKIALSDAREDRAALRKTRRMAKKDLRKARRQHDSLPGVTSALATADRDLMEARDNVDLQKAILSTRRAHVDLEKGRLARAKADRELQESLMLQVEDANGQAWHRSKRYRNQLHRISQRTADLRSDWNLARVELQERRQDHWTGESVFATPVATHKPHPATPSALASEFNPMVSYIPVGAVVDDMPIEEEMDLRRVHFDLNSAVLDTDALNSLAWNAHVLRNSRDTAVRIEGHTDKSGDMAYNRALAWDRAEAIERYLIEAGVWRSQMETAAYGETKPLVGEPALASVNRRAELRVLEDPDGLVDGTTDNDWEDDFTFDVDTTPRTSDAF